MKKSEHLVRKNPGYKIITAEEPGSYAAEAFRRIKVCIDSLSVDTNIQVIQICSAQPGDGKTTTLLNMAVTYAESGKKVLLMDMDLRKPKMHRAFNDENVNGLTDYLTGNVTDFHEVVKPTKHQGIYYVCAGPTPIRPNVLLASRKLRAFVEKMRSVYDVILIDEPPILASFDCCIISKFCDGAVFQISRKNTEIPAAKFAVKTLRQNGVNLLGCTFTEVDNDSDSYSYSYKYHY